MQGCKYLTKRLSKLRQSALTPHKAACFFHSVSFYTHRQYACNLAIARPQFTQRAANNHSLFVQKPSPSGWQFGAASLAALATCDLGMRFSNLVEGLSNLVLEREHTHNAASQSCQLRRSPWLRLALWPVIFDRNAVFKKGINSPRGAQRHAFRPKTFLFSRCEQSSGAGCVECAIKRNNLMFMK